jgi:hypothetical protein
VYECFDGSLNAYLDKYLKIIALFNNFTVQHVSRDENMVVNDLAQQTCCLRSNQGKLYVLKKSDVPVCHTRLSDFRLMQGSEICSTKPDLAKSNGLVLEIG